MAKNIYQQRDEVVQGMVDDMHRRLKNPKGGAGFVPSGGSGNGASFGPLDRMPASGPSRIKSPREAVKQLPFPKIG